MLKVFFVLKWLHLPPNIMNAGDLFGDLETRNSQVLSKVQVTTQNGQKWFDSMTVPAQLNSCQIFGGKNPWSNACR